MTRAITRLYYLVILIAGLLPGRALAQGPAVPYAPDPAQLRILGPGVGIYFDSSTRMQLGDILRSQPAFAPAGPMVLNLGVSKAAAWFRLPLANPRNDQELLLQVENPMLDDVTLFHPDGNGGFREERISKDKPFGARAIKSPNYLFALSIPPGRTDTFYLRVQSYTQLMVPINFGSQQRILEADHDKDILTAIFFGIMMVMFLYNLFVFSTVRDRSYLYYILYILSVTLVQLNIEGFGFCYLWPDWIWLEQHAPVLFSALTAFTSIAFTRRFLRTSHFAPWIHRGFWVFIVAYAATVLIALFGDRQLSYNLLNINALPLALYMIFTGGYIWLKKKYRPGMFFFIAWSVFMVGIILFVMKDVGVLPYNLATVSVIQIGSAIETMLLSFALADRINTLKKEKEASQALALKAAQENERIVREQNIILETKVKERTKELQQSNEDLATALGDLKEAQAQLVEQEKMASLGQLTAGIAHEINNPINFVTSNVKPLKRDMDMLLDLLDQIEGIGLSEKTAEEKTSSLKKLKQEYDFDYLKEEIDILLKGIQEGSSRTAEIVKGLRIFSRLDEDDLKKANMNEGLDSTTIIVNNLLNNKIEILKSYEELPLIECYPGKLNQVFLNMITNAIHSVKAHFGENSGGKITLSTRADDKYVYVTIADNGMGMDNATKAKIFEPFFTTKDVGEGTGLGLSIAYNTIKKHNGSIHLETSPGNGAAFTLQLPIIHEIQIS